MFFVCFSKLVIWFVDNNLCILIVFLRIWWNRHWILIEIVCLYLRFRRIIFIWEIRIEIVKNFKNFHDLKFHIKIFFHIWSFVFDLRIRYKILIFLLLTFFILFLFRHFVFFCRLWIVFEIFGFFLNWRFFFYVCIRNQIVVVFHIRAINFFENKNSVIWFSAIWFRYFFIFFIAFLVFVNFFFQK